MTKPDKFTLVSIMYGPRKDLKVVEDMLNAITKLCSEVEIAYWTWSPKGAE